MSPEDLKRLRGFYHSLQNLERVLAGMGAVVFNRAHLQSLIDELSRLGSSFPNLIPPMPLDRFSAGGGPDGEVRFYATSVLSHLAVVVGRLSVEIESAETTPVTEVREFKVISDQKLRVIIERDYTEAQRAFISQCWKSVIILSGGTIEAILLDVVGRDPVKAKASPKAPKKPDVARWDFAELIDVAVDLKLVAPYLASLSDATRSYRNLVHPGVELRTQLKFGAEEARIALAVLQMIQRDLS
jgi:hypothetical protein